MLDWLQFLDQSFKLATDFGSLVQKVIEIKHLLANTEPNPQAWQQMPPGWNLIPMQPFTARTHDLFAGGAHWLPQLQNLAAQFGNPWVPAQTTGFLGVDLTGIWAPPLNPLDQTYIRQFGPYLNLIVGIAGVPTGFGEGFFVPNQATICMVGRYVIGAPFEARAKLFPNWTLQGGLTSVNAFGMPMQLPLFMAKMA